MKKLSELRGKIKGRLVAAILPLVDTTTRKIPQDLFEDVAFAARKNSGQEGMAINRALNYSGAAVCLLILLGLLPIEHKSTVLKASTTLVSLSLPLWIALAIVSEMYLLLGPKSYPHYEVTLRNKFTVLLAGTAAFSLYLAVAGVIWTLLPLAGVIFITTSALVLGYVLLWTVSLEINWRALTKAEQEKAASPADL